MGSLVYYFRPPRRGAASPRFKVLLPVDAVFKEPLLSVNSVHGGTLRADVARSAVGRLLPLSLLYWWLLLLLLLLG